MSLIFFWSFLTYPPRAFRHTDQTKCAGSAAARIVKFEFASALLTDPLYKPSIHYKAKSNLVTGNSRVRKQPMSVEWTARI